jgi:predicted transposase/invertase (TIGR01784 family)
MYETDTQSNIATAEDNGRREGRQEGAFAIARNLLGMNMPLDQIVTATGLTREEVEKLDV